jgi:hypothetical protein
VGPQNLEEFDGKIVFVSLFRGNEAAYVLKDVRLESIGDRQFLSGSIVPGLMPGFDGHVVLISLTSIESMMGFDSYTDYVYACRTYGWARWRAKWASRLNWFYGGD